MYSCCTMKHHDCFEVKHVCNWAEHHWAPIKHYVSQNTFILKKKKKKERPQNKLGLVQHKCLEENFSNISKMTSKKTTDSIYCQWKIMWAFTQISKFWQILSTTSTLRACSRISWWGWWWYKGRFFFSCCIKKCVNILKIWAIQCANAWYW